MAVQWGRVSLPLTTMSSAATDNAQTSKPNAGRLPSLNQLAARININASPAAALANNNTTTAAPRPRLAAFALRTGSSTSVATNDSTAVNVPASTRSTSPSTISTSSPPGSIASSLDGGGDPLTADKLEKLNQETAVPEKKNVKVGYKNIPSLDAITARLAKARALSVDGTPKPPEPQMIEDPKTPGVHMKAPEHPLQFSWYVISLDQFRGGALFLHSS